MLNTGFIAAITPVSFFTMANSLQEKSGPAGGFGAPGF